MDDLVANKILDTLKEIKEELRRDKLRGKTLGYDDLSALLGVSKVSLQGRVVVSPDFPPPVYIQGVIGKRWLLKDVEDWLEENKMFSQKKGRRVGRPRKNF